MTPRVPPAISQEQAVQIALQYARTVRVLLPVNSSYHSSALKVNPQPTHVSFYNSFQIYPKWRVMFNLNFSSPVEGYSRGSMLVQVAADTGNVDYSPVTDVNYNILLVDSNYSEPMPTVAPTPTATPTLTPTPSPTPSLAPSFPPNSLPAADFEWERRLLPGNGYSVFPLVEGGYVLSAADEFATFLVKTDAEGNLKSAKAVQINGETTLLPYLAPTADGGYAFGGVWANQYALVKTDSDGDVQWTHLYSSEAPTNYFRSFIQTSDGGFAIAGYGEEEPEGEGWIWLAKTDAGGNLQWNRSLSGPIADCPSTIIELEDGYMLSDVTFSVEPNQAYVRLIRTDPAGNMLWSQTYGGEGDYSIPECNCAIRTADDGYLLGGFLAGRNAWVVKTDAAGAMQWNKTYGGKDSAITCAQQTSDGGYVLAAVENATDAWLLKIDSAGNEEWSVAFPEAAFPVGLEANFNSVIQTGKGDYVIVGTKDSSVLLMKIRSPNATPPFPWLLAALTNTLAMVFTTTVILRARSKRRGKSRH